MSGVRDVQSIDLHWIKGNCQWFGWIVRALKRTELENWWQAHLERGIWLDFLGHRMKILMSHVNASKEQLLQTRHWVIRQNSVLCGCQGGSLTQLPSAWLWALWTKRPLQQGKGWGNRAILPGKVLLADGPVERLSTNVRFLYSELKELCQKGI